MDEDYERFVGTRNIRATMNMAAKVVEPKPIMQCEELVRQTRPLLGQIPEPVSSWR